MHLNTVLEYNKPETMDQNDLLLEIARKVVNSSPEPRYKIKLRDEVLAMKEKERLGFNFNRSVTASLKARWDVVEKATVDYLGEILDMNEQIEEDNRKYENQLVNLIVTRTTNLSLDTRIEQMAGLFTHMNFYCTVLRYKIQHLEQHKHFMVACCDSLGFSRPSQLMDRYAALQHVFSELYTDYESRQNQLNSLNEILSEIKAETSHRNMLMRNQMATLHEHLKHKQTENAEKERSLHEQIAIDSITSLDIYKIRNAVYNLYTAMMAYRGMDAHEMNALRQLDELEIRISHTQAVVKDLEDESKLKVKKTQKKKQQSRDSLETAEEEDDLSEKSDISLNMSKTRAADTHKNKNVSAIDSVSFDSHKLRQANARNQNSSSVRSRATRCEKFDVKRSQSRAGSMSLPPINVTGSLITAVTQDETEQQKLADRLRLLDNNSNILIWRDAFKARGKVRSECACNTNSNTVIWSDYFNVGDKFKSDYGSDTTSNTVIPRDDLRKKDNFRWQGRSYSTGKSQSCNLVKRLLKRSDTVEVGNQSCRKDGNISSHVALPRFPLPHAGSWTKAIRRYSDNKAGPGLIPIEEIQGRGSSDELRQAKPCSGSSNEPEKQVCTSSESEGEESENVGESKIGEGVTQKEINLKANTARDGDPAMLPRRSSVSETANIPGTMLRARNTQKTRADKTRTVSAWIEKRKFRENCLDILSKVKLRSSPRK